MPPPITGPSTGPISVTIHESAIARAMRFGPAAWARIVWPTGIISPPPTPCSTRKPTSEPRLHARPHATDPSTNSATDAIHTRFAPNRSAVQPASGTTVPSASR